MPGLHKQSRVKKEKRAVDMTETPAVDVPRFEGPTTTEQDVEPLWPRGGFDLQMVNRQTRAVEDGRLVDFAVSLEGRPEGSGGGWSNLARVDCSNGFVHVDVGNDKHDASAVPVECRTHLEAARRWAIGYCWDAYGRLS